MILAVTNLKLTFEKASRISGQLNMASAVAVFALLPLFLNQIDMTPGAMWRLASALYLVTVMMLLVIGFRRARGGQQTGSMAKLVVIPGTSAIFLLGWNIVHASVWPYFFQLLIAWIVSLALFLAFIQDVLNDKVKSDEAAL